ncbi:MAG: hemerythrin family protein [Gammaproteobacteria bacterium]|nr:hemerythrin family protein [Gammaproteobacteria bacterium]
MTLIEWKDEFSVGVPSVDHEHRELVKLINDGFRNFQEKDSGFRVDDFLGEIFAKISSHFALEEKVMRNHKYDQIAEHKEDHERLLDDIRDMMDVYENQGYFNEKELADHLAAWFTGHFKKHDARLHGKLGL